ncbi:MAG: sulfatase/phosphatase domain-containing protein, partial [Opitutaceae bacterium]
VPFIGTDLLPTLAAATGAGLLRDVTLDGRNVLPLWLGAAEANPDRAFTWHFPYYHPETGYGEARPAIGVDDFAVSRTRPHSSLRVGHWKLLHFYDDNRDELYDLAADPSEQRDLAPTDPARTRTLRARLESELRTQGARLPLRAN